MMGELPPLPAAEAAYVNSVAAISRIGPAPFPPWADAALYGVGVIGFVLTAYVLIKAWRDRKK